MFKLFIIFCSFCLICCLNSDKKKSENNYASFGDSISSDKYLDNKELYNQFLTLKESDTLNIKVKTIIKDVCSKKGCWVTFQLNENTEAFVKFKDYGFFMPLNASGSNAIINGKAFIAVETVESLKHYAKDEGKSQEEIDQITKPQVTYSILADGVLLEKSK